MKCKVKINEKRNRLVGFNPIYKNKFPSNCLIVNETFIYQIQFDPQVPEQTIEVDTSTKHAIFKMESCSSVQCKPFQPKGSHQLQEVTMLISMFSRPPQNVQIIAEQLQKEIKKEKLLINNWNNFIIIFKGVQLNLNPTIAGDKPYGIIVDQTCIQFKKAPAQRLQIIEDDKNFTNLFANYESKVKNLRVGGQHEQLELIDRRVFGTRMLNPKMMRMLGLKHIKGMLLYGPPGTGKTLIARQISKILKVEAKIVNGPEIFSENVGVSERNIRQLFDDAIKSQQEKGMKSQLHCIIFDQIDALCRKRGSNSSNGVYDLVVNQLLTCIDGINTLNNILVIGITNRKDLIDEAILRPGRLQVHIEINIPDETGRLEILNIHTQLMRNNEFLSDKVDLSEIARITKNYTGAQIEGVVKSAQSFALQKWKSNPEDVQTRAQCKIDHEEFLRGVKEVIPQFGRDNKILEAIIPKNQIIVPKYTKTLNTINQTIKNLKEGKHTILIKGQSGVGKTVLAAQCAMKSEFLFSKIISSDKFLGLNEGQIVNEIVSIFQDASKCGSSLIILDDIMRLIDFVPLGPRYSATLLNLLINSIKKILDPSKKQIILATVTSQQQFNLLGFSKYFKYIFNMQKLNELEISEILKTCGFEGTKAMAISREIKSATLKKIVDITMIEGAQNVENWLMYWNEYTDKNS